MIHKEVGNEGSENMTAKYQQIANNIQDRIESGELQDGDRLQSERELSNQLGVNRLTVRRAFNVLENRGLVDRRQGGGTYVAAQPIERPASHLVPFTIAMQSLGVKPGARLIAFDKVAADQSLSELLQIPIQSPLYHIFRVRLADNEPAVIEQFFTSCQLFPNFDTHDHEARSGYEIMETEYGISVIRAEQSLEPVAATPYEAELLGMSPGMPLMLERRLAFDKNNQPIEYGKDLFRGDMFKFVTTDAPLTLSYSHPE